MRRIIIFLCIGFICLARYSLVYGDTAITPNSSKCNELIAVSAASTEGHQTSLTPFKATRNEIHRIKQEDRKRAENNREMLGLIWASDTNIFQKLYLIFFHLDRL